jgi:uncharacterized DUF497 family protein
MKVIWDAEKNNKLIRERAVSFETFENLILSKKYLDILENQSRKGQYIFVIPYLDYTYVVPFVIDQDENIVLKTIFPSRKFHKLYGGKDEKDYT